MSNARELSELAGSYGTGGFVGMKNRIINGAMVIAQYGTSNTTASGFQCVDRWRYNQSQANKGTWNQNFGSITPPVGFSNYLGFQTGGSSYSVLTGDYFFFDQVIEGFNVADFAWGTANAKAATLSFWAYSSLTGTFGGSLRNNTSGGVSYPFTYTISSANTWTYITVAITAPTTGSFATNNTAGLNICFGLGAGSTYSGAAGSWSANNYVSATGATSVVGTASATFYITGVQLEKGSTATSFDYRPYGTEFDLCRRYCEVYSNVNCDFVPSTIAQTDVSNRPEINIDYYPKRTGPTITVSNNNLQFNTLANTSIAITGYAGTLVGTRVNGSNMFFNTASGVTSGALSGAGVMQFTATCSIVISAEL